MTDQELLAQIDSAIKSKTDLNQLDSEGNAFIHYAAELGSRLSMDNLLEAGANVDQANIYGVTALMLAAIDGHLGIIDVLIENNANYNSRCSEGKTAKDYGKTEDVSQHIQKRVNEHQYDVLIKHPQHQHNEVFKQIPKCPISRAPISYLLCTITNGITNMFEKSALTEALNNKKVNPLNRQPLTLDRCFDDDDEQQRINDTWKKVSELYIKYQKEQSDPAGISMFSPSPTSGNNKNSEQEEPVQSQKRKMG